MTDTIEQKALALVLEIERARECPEWAQQPSIKRKQFGMDEALCRAIEQHEAFRQEVSQRAKKVLDVAQTVNGYANAREAIERELSSLVIAKPDPLVEALEQLDWPPAWVDDLRAAIEKRGGKIVWGEG